MKKHIKTWIYQLAIMAGLFVNTTSCSKSVDNTQAPTPIPSLTTVTDIDGNLYHTITIGTQVWMVENLKTTHYRNGDAIPNVKDSAAWISINTGAYCWSHNDEASYKFPYGALYNWYAVNDTRQLCPPGWHVPNYTEWSTVTAFLGGKNLAGGKMKETGTSHWKAPNDSTTNTSGFTGLPGGWRDGVGSTGPVGYEGFWWSSTKNFSSDSWGIGMIYDDVALQTSTYFNTDGRSVRCIKDL
jgi:uncharacterized protein (TIGR02145 family)